MINLNGGKKDLRKLNLDLTIGLLLVVQPVERVKLLLHLILRLASLDINLSVLLLHFFARVRAR